MNWKELEPKVEELKKREIATMSQIKRLTSQNNKYPTIPQSFISAKNLVEKAEYNVVVCGEVKKGKSSLLNAIVGQEILPVNSEIATSQVFRISNSSHESFELVFTDGTRKSITREQLSRYGSQVDANLHGEPVFQNRNLSYIQVNIPIAFLPRGVSLVDTPGLGALYKSHEWITQNYVSNASAILFVLDPERPIESQEKKFILKALDVTKDIIFVMTKIDLYTPEAWSSILQRNEAILADIFATKGDMMPHIMPVSSAGLMKASTGKVKALNEINLKNSKFPELKSELIKIMFRGVGIHRTGQALNEAVNHTTKVNNLIDDMLKVCIVDNQKEQQIINERMMQQQEKLQSEWGQQSNKRQQIIEEINAICSSLQNRVQLMVSSSGPIFKEYEQKINALSTMDGVKNLGRTMPQEVVNDVSSQWQSIARETEERVAAVLSNVSSRIGNVGVNGIGGEASRLEIKQLTTMEKINCWRGAAFIGGVGTSLAASIGAFAVPVIGPIIGVALGVVGWLFGKRQKENNEVERNKQNFKQELVSLLNELSTKLLYVQGSSNRSVVHQFAYDLDKNAKEAIQSFFEDRKNQLKKDLENIEQQARADQEARRRDAEMWNKEKKEWTVIVNELKQEIVLRNHIEQALNSCK